MTRGIISKLLWQQATAKLSADRRGDALMQCFLLTTWDEGNGGTATALIPSHARPMMHAFIDLLTEFWNSGCLYHRFRALWNCTSKEQVNDF